MHEVQGTKKELTLLASKSSTIHSLAHHPQHESDGVFHFNVILVLLLEQTLCSAIVRSDACRFPARIVSRGIGMVKLEVIVRVVTGIEKRNTKWSETYPRNELAMGDKIWNLYIPPYCV